MNLKHKKRRTNKNTQTNSEWFQTSVSPPPPQPVLRVLRPPLRGGLRRRRLRRDCRRSRRARFVLRRRGRHKHRHRHRHRHGHAHNHRRRGRPPRRCPFPWHRRWRFARDVRRPHACAREPRRRPRRRHRPAAAGHRKAPGRREVAAGRGARSSLSKRGCARNAMSVRQPIPTIHKHMSLFYDSLLSCCMRTWTGDPTCRVS